MDDKPTPTNWPECDFEASDFRQSTEPDFYTHSQIQTLAGQDSIWVMLSMLNRANNPIDALQRLSEKMEGCVRVNLKDERILFLSDAAHFKHVLVTKADHYVKYYDWLTPLFGKSMITVDGRLWQTIRSPQQFAFQPKIFGEYLPGFLASVREKSIDFEHYASTGETIDLIEETWGLAASMVCKALFDRDVPFNPHLVFRAVKAYTDVGNHRDIWLKKVKGELTEVPLEGVAAGAIASWISMPPSVLGAVPRDHRERTLLKILEEAMADPSRPAFDTQQVLDELKQYIWAGTETTALTLAWCFYLLHGYPEVAERIRKEGEDAYGDRVPTWDDIHALSYTRAVIQETMRLYPPVWSIIRIATAEDELSGHRVLPGNKIVLCPYIVHRSARYWDAPETFDPSRFSPENMKRRAPYSYLPFSAGRRACIGGALSIVENTLALTKLLRRFRLEYLGETPARIAATVTLTPEGGVLPFRVHVR